MSALRRLRPRVRSGVGPKTTKARCRIRARSSAIGCTVDQRGLVVRELERRNVLVAPTPDAALMILRRYRALAG